MRKAMIITVLVMIMSALVLSTNYAAGLTISGTVTTTVQQALEGTNITVVYAKPLIGASIKLFPASDKALEKPLAPRPQLRIMAIIHWISPRQTPIMS